MPNAENLNLLLRAGRRQLLVQSVHDCRRRAGRPCRGDLRLGVPAAVLIAPPVVALFLGSLPFSGCSGAGSKRISQFVEAMPEAVELISRALRAGHGLASGLHLVAEEMKGPIADEFNRVFEEQNLGIPIELALRNMADRIPVMDVRFFVIAVIIQRSTGGDLAEVLDKIGRLIRQRFELRGHVKSLTAEGRLSGIVLLAMPPALLGVSLFHEL